MRSFHCCYKAGNSGDIAYYVFFSAASRRHNDVILTSFSVYLFTVPANIVCVKLLGLATKIFTLFFSVKPVLYF